MNDDNDAVDVVIDLNIDNTDTTYLTPTLWNSLKNKAAAGIVRSMR